MAVKPHQIFNAMVKELNHLYTMGWYTPGLTKEERRSFQEQHKSLSRIIKEIENPT